MWFDISCKTKLYHSAITQQIPLYMRVDWWIYHKFNPLIEIIYQKVKLGKAFYKTISLWDYTHLVYVDYEKIIWWNTVKLKKYLHISWKLLHKLTVRSASTDINVWISPFVNFERSARFTNRHLKQHQIIYTF